MLGLNINKIYYIIDMKNLFNSIKLYFEYRKIILKNKDILKNSYNIDIDWVNRLYTVINIPENEIGEAFNLKKSDIDVMSRKYIDDYVRFINKWYSDNSLLELVELYEFKKISKYSYLMVTGYSLFRTNRIANLIFYFLIPSSILTSIILLIF